MICRAYRLRKVFKLTPRNILYATTVCYTLSSGLNQPEKPRGIRYKCLITQSEKFTRIFHLSGRQKKIKYFSSNCHFQKFFVSGLPDLLPTLPMLIHKLHFIYL